MAFNYHDRVVFNGLLYSVRFRSWSFYQHCYTLGLVPFYCNSSSVIWVRSDLVNKAA